MEILGVITRDNNMNNLVAYFSKLNEYQNTCFCASALEGRQRVFKSGLSGVRQRYGLRHAVVIKNVRKGAISIYLSPFVLLINLLSDNLGFYRIQLQYKSIDKRALFPFSPFFIKIKTGFISFYNKMYMDGVSRRGFLFDRLYASFMCFYRKNSHV